MLKETRKVLSFMKRDMLLATAYKLAFLSGYMNLILQLFLFIFFTQMFQINKLPLLAAYGGDPIAYILIGVSGWTYLWTSMNSPSAFLRSEMLTGTFEYIFYTPTSKYAIISSYVIRGMAISTVLMVFYLVLGFTFFNVSLQGNYLYALVIMAISILMMTGFGLMIAGLKVYYKEAGTVVSVFQTVAVLFSNVYFDVSILPSTLRPIAYFCPTYYSITGIRIALLSQNPQYDQIISYIEILLIVAAVALVFGAVAFNKAFDKARKEGTLAYY